MKLEFSPLQLVKGRIIDLELLINDLRDKISELLVSRHKGELSARYVASSLASYRTKERFLKSLLDINNRIYIYLTTGEESWLEGQDFITLEQKTPMN